MSLCIFFNVFKHFFNKIFFFAFLKAKYQMIFEVGSGIAFLP